MITLINVKNLAFTGQVLARVGAFIPACFESQKGQTVKNPKFGSRVSVEEHRVDTKWVHFYQTFSKQKSKHKINTGCTVIHRVYSNAEGFSILFISYSSVIFESTL
jgi:hypothetical protein